MITQTQEFLLQLLRASLSGTESPIPDSADWDAVIDEAGIQAVVGLIAKLLPKDKQRTYGSRTKAFFLRVLHGQTELVRLFDAADIPLVILKGMAAAMYYPKASERSMGDVDFLVPQDRFSDALELMAANGYVMKEDPSDIEKRHVSYRKGGVVFELHHHFSSFALDLEPILIDGMSRAVRRQIGDCEFPTLPNPENALVLLAHVRQHLMESGLGLRQVLDWMQCLQSLTPEEEEQLKKYARETGQYTLACTMNRVCNDWLGTSFTWEGKTEAAEELLEFLFECGNFGEKRGTDRPVEAVSLSVRAMGLFPYLQDMGLHNWKAARKYTVLRPFAWMHTVCRYAKKGALLLLRPGAIQDQLSGAKRLDDLLSKLEL